MGTTAFKTTDSSHSPDGFFAERKAHSFRGPADSFKGFPTRLYGRDEPWSASRRMLSVFAFSHFTLHLDFILSGQVLYLHLLPTRRSRTSTSKTSFLLATPSGGQSLCSLVTSLISEIRRVDS